LVHAKSHPIVNATKIIAVKQPTIVAGSLKPLDRLYIPSETLETPRKPYFVKMKPLTKPMFPVPDVVEKWGNDWTQNADTQWLSNVRHLDEFTFLHRYICLSLGSSNEKMVIHVACQTIGMMPKPSSIK